MQFSIVIPTFDRNDLLRKCVDQLHFDKQKLDKSLFEVIVSDDGRSDSTRRTIEDSYPWIRWVEGPYRGPAANRNNGASFAKGEWLVFLDDDVIPSNTLLSSYRKAIEDNKSVQAFEGGIFPDDWDLLKIDMSECPINDKGNCFWSANICVSRQLFEELDGFDENFLLAAQEDQDLFERIKQNKAQTMFVKNASVVHPVRFVSLSRLLKRIPRSIVNWYLFERKHHRQTLKRILSTTIKLFSDYLLSFFANLKRRKPKTALYFVACIFIGIPVYVYTVCNKD